jgi:hypothetical protein
VDIRRSSSTRDTSITIGSINKYTHSWGMARTVY